MNHKSLKHSFSTLIIVVLFACGGTSSSTPPKSAYQQAYDLASAKMAEAISLGVESPCAQVQECGLLVFKDPGSSCAYKYADYPYSLISPTAAAAQTATAEQNVLADKAIALAPPLFPSTPCTPGMYLPRNPVCVTGKCGAV
jgi:hypothetical protein